MARQFNLWSEHFDFNKTSDTFKRNVIFNF